VRGFLIFLKGRASKSVIALVSQDNEPPQRP
jgi:hypothetical protein